MREANKIFNMTITSDRKPRNFLLPQESYAKLIRLIIKDAKPIRKPLTITSS